MKMLKQVCLLACLPLLLEAAEVVRFDATAHVATNSPNTRYDFSLDPSAPMVSKSVTGGYSGPDVYGAMNMSSQGFWLGFADTLVANYAWFDDYLDRLMAVSLDDVKRVAADVFRPNQRTIGWYVPTGNGTEEAD